MSDDLEEAEDIVELGSDILEQSEALTQQFGLQLFGRVELGTETEDDDPDHEGHDRDEGRDP